MRVAASVVLSSALLLPLAGCGGGGDVAPPGPPAPTIVALGDLEAAPPHVSQADAASGALPLDDLLDAGGAFFVASFNALDGAGRPESTGTGAHRDRRVAPQNFNRISGPDSNSCAGCHNLPRPGGGGDNVANVFVLGQARPFVNFDGGAGDDFQDLTLHGVADERNTLGMFGSGFIELLAREMTTQLHAIRDAAVAQAMNTNQDTSVGLVTKGVSFGVLLAHPDGSLDTAGVEGIDADLVVRPFHQKGVVVSLREFTVNAMNHHHGMQASERFGAGADPDADGVVDELGDGDITAVTLWQATLPPPGRVLPADDAGALAAVATGESLFGALGCATCHVPTLVLQDPVFTEPGPFNPAGTRNAGEIPSVAVDLTTAGPGPRPAREANGTVLVHAYTDLKRHDMGPALDTEALVQAGVPTSMFLTKKLWGMSNEPPFLHHGRATTIREAILLHGGEAQAARDAFAGASAADQDAVLAFLKTLQVLPEDAPAPTMNGTFSGFVGDEPALAAGHVDQAEVDAGLWTPEALFARGRVLFNASFNTLDGAGRPESTGTGAPRSRRESPQNFNRISGPDSNACAGCHNHPRSGGGGDNVANVFVLGQARPFVNFDGGEGDDFQDLTLDTVANERNTLGMFGSGYIELLAREMTAELQQIRAASLAAAQGTGAMDSRPLVAKGVSFGAISTFPNGSVDTAGVIGVDGDLVVKPFHQKGVVVSLREFTNNAMNHHHGMQAAERFGVGTDPDADGVVNELTVGDQTATTIYQALLAVPGRVLPADPGERAGVDRGEMLFQSTGCATCHRPTLLLDDPVFTEPNPYNPAGNLRPQDVPQVLSIDLTTHGEAPRLPRRGDGKVEVPAYTDLKRHDMGPDLEEPLVQAGVGGRLFLTRKLWGMASEPPFMHHGRATTLDEAIRMHGGEGAGARDAYVAMPETDRHCLVDFLRTLQVVAVGEPLEVVR